MQTLESGVQLFYDISGVHNKRVKPPTMQQGKRIFIQSTSQGSMCLEEGMTILYKVNTELLESEEYRDFQILRVIFPSLEFLKCA